MRKTEKCKPILCQTCGELLTVKHLIIHCQINTEISRSPEIPDNLNKAMGQNKDNSTKVIYFLNLLVSSYNLI